MSASRRACAGGIWISETCSFHQERVARSAEAGSERAGHLQEGRRRTRSQRRPAPARGLLEAHGPEDGLPGPATEPGAKAERTGVDVSAEASMARLAVGARVTPGPRRRGGPARRQGFRCALLRSASSESDGKASDIFNKESDTIRLLHRELRNPGRGRVWTLRGRLRTHDDCQRATTEVRPQGAVS